MERKFVRSHVMAIGLALALGMLAVLSLLAGLGGLRPPGALAVSETLPTASNARALAATGSITGLAQADDSGAPLAGVVVKIYDGVSFALLYTTTTDADGHYSATVTSPYSQARLFFDGRAVAYASEWYDDKAFFSQADRVYLQEGAVVTGVNVSLAERGIMSGTITLEGGAPAIDVCVTLLEVNKGCDAHTDALGQFIIADLMSGTYRLMFSGGAFPGVWPEYYRDKSSPDVADGVTVTAGATAAITAEVTSRNVITGLVTDEFSGLAISNASVKLYDEAGIITRDLTLPCLSCAPGEYRFSVVNPGHYRLEFSHLPYHVTEFYSDQQTLTNATVVSITAAQVITGVNAALTTGLTGTLAVTLTQDNYQPLSSTHAAYVELYDPSSGDGLATIGSINGDGSTVTYTFVVSGGDYLVYLGANYPLLGEWYDDQPVSSTAEIVSITPGATTTISANLTALTTTTILGCITGAVTSGVAPLQDAQVWVYKAGRDWREPTTTGADGAYGPVCIEPGDYQVSFSYFPSMTTWYSGALARATAATVAITSGVTLTDVNGILGDLGGCISGRVVNASGQGVESASFQIRDAGGSLLPFWQGLNDIALTDNGDTDLDGGFVACGLASGLYSVQSPGVGSASVSVTAPLETGGVICKPYTIYLPVVMRDSG
jgi:hypothetical protein